MQKYYKKWFFPLVAPAMIFFLAVVIIPFLIGLVYSFTGWRGTYFNGGGAWYESFVGFDNYIRTFKNERFMTSLVYTTKFTVLAVVAINIVALSFALMLNSLKKGVGIFRTVFFMPNMLGGLAMGFVWQFVFEVIFTELIFSPDGIFHAEFMRYMLQDQTKGMVAMVIMMTWQMAGYMMLIYISGLNSISGELHEAAEIDGAGPVKKFFSITLPLLMSSITVVLFMTLANSFKMLDINVALTNGDFNTRLIALQILRVVKDTSPPDYGLAQAQSVIFFIIVATIALAQVYFTRRKEVEL